MALEPSSVIGLVAVLALVYKYVIFPAILSPLARVPNAHWSCGFCPLWLYWMRWSQQENCTVYRKHLERGPALRLAPNVLSLNSFEDGLKKIYQGGFPKTDFYFRGFQIYKTHNIFTIEENAPHAVRKRLISSTFKKSFVMSSVAARASISDILTERLLPLIHKHALSHEPLEILEIMYSYSMDAFIQWQFGRSLGSNFLQNKKERKMYLDGWFALATGSFWQLEFPRLAAALRYVGIYLIPKWVDVAFAAAENWNLEKCDRAHQLLVSDLHLCEEDTPVLFEHALQMMSGGYATKRSYAQRIEIASDMFTHNSAAFETMGNTLAYLFYELSRNPSWQTRLKDELLTLKPQLIFSDRKEYSLGDLPTPKDVDELPILHAVLTETLRRYPVVPGGQPRRVPEPSSLGGYDNIPAGTTVHCSAYSIHNNPAVFNDPFAWKPERWLESTPEQITEMKRWFWAFGSGGRKCIGMYFAYFAMKMAVVGIYSNFRTTIYFHGDMELVDAFIAGPKGRRLELKFQPLERDTETHA